MAVTGNAGVLKLIGGIFFAVGLLLGSIAASLFVAHARFASSAAHAEGVVVEDHGCPRVKFQVGERTFEIHGSFSTRPPSFTEGESVPVLYPQDNPAAGQLDTLGQSYFAVILLGCLGTVFGGLGGAFLLFVIRARRRRERAMAMGTRVQATVTSITRDGSTRVNGRSPWVIEATYADAASGRSFLFTSESIWIDPQPFYPVGGEVTVFYLEDEPTVNAVVLDALPEAV